MMMDLGVVRTRPRPTPTWMEPGSTFHIRTRSTSYINGSEFVRLRSLLYTSSAGSFSRDSDQWGLKADGTFKKFTAGVPAITDLGLLVEPEETNLALRSLGIYTVSTAGTRTTGNFDNIGPFGVFARQMIADGASGSHLVGSGTGTNLVVSGTTYLIWAIVEAMTADYFQLTTTTATFNTQVYANFDIRDTDGVVGTKGTSTLSSGMQKLASGRFVVWLTAEATASGTSGISFAIVPSNSSGRTASSTSTASVIISANQFSTATRWGSLINTNDGAPVTRPETVVVIKPPADTYDIVVKFGDGTADQTLSGQVVTSDGWTIPTNLNGRFITEIIGTAA